LVLGAGGIGGYFGGRLAESGADLAACKRILADVTEAERTASGEYAAPTGELPVTALRAVSKPARQRRQ